MLKAFLYFLVVIASDIDNFIEKDVRIFLSTANHIFIGMDDSDKKVMSKSKYGELKNFISEAWITPDGQYYRMQFGDNPICAVKEAIKKCTVSTNWVIKKETLGYSISDGSKCMTLIGDDMVGMSSCTDSNDQIFDFKLSSDDQGCGVGPSEELKKYNKNVVVIALNNSGKCGLMTNNSCLSNWESLRNCGCDTQYAHMLPETKKVQYVEDEPVTYVAPVKKQQVTIKKSSKHVKAISNPVLMKEVDSSVFPEPIKRPAVIQEAKDSPTYIEPIKQAASMEERKSAPTYVQESGRGKIVKEMEEPSSNSQTGYVMQKMHVKKIKNPAQPVMIRDGNRVPIYNKSRQNRVIVKYAKPMDPMTDAPNHVFNFGDKMNTGDESEDENYDAIESSTENLRDVDMVDNEYDASIETGDEEMD